MTAPKKRKGAAKPAPRTVEVKLAAPFEGWTATLRADPKLNILAGLNSEDFDRVVAGLDGLVIEHNFPDEDGDVAASMGEVDPGDAVTALVERYGAAISALPPR